MYRQDNCLPLPPYLCVGFSFLLNPSIPCVIIFISSQVDQRNIESRGLSSLKTQEEDTSHQVSDHSHRFWLKSPMNRDAGLQDFTSRLVTSSSWLVVYLHPVLPYLNLSCPFKCTRIASKVLLLMFYLDFSHKISLTSWNHLFISFRGKSTELYLLPHICLIDLWENLNWIILIHSSLNSL